MEELRDEIAEFEFNFMLYIAKLHGISMSANSWEKLDGEFKAGYYRRAGKILNLFKQANYVQLTDDQKCMLRDSSRNDWCVFFKQPCMSENACPVYREFTQQGWRKIKVEKITTILRKR